MSHCIPIKSQFYFRIASVAGNSRPSSKMSNEAPRERKAATAEQARDGARGCYFITDLGSVKSCKIPNHEP